MTPGTPTLADIQDETANVVREALRRFEAAGWAKSEARAILYAVRESGGDEVRFALAVWGWANQAEARKRL